MRDVAISWFLVGAASANLVLVFASFFGVTLYASIVVMLAIQGAIAFRARCTRKPTPPTQTKET